MILLYRAISNLSKEAQFFVIFCIIISAIYLSNLVKKRVSKPKSRRKSDKQKPNNRDKQVFETARNLASFGKFVSAAQLLESIGYVREAIALLEGKGYIDEAANILLKLQNPERAGAMYAQHGMWDKATRCYLLAKMPNEAAKCSQEAGKVHEAAESFAEAGEYTKAANCFLDIGNIRQAAQYFVKSSKTKQAVECYKKACDQVDDVKELSLSDEELSFIHTELLHGEERLFLADILSAHEKLADLLVDLLEADRINQASQYYLRSTKDISEYLIANVPNQFLPNLSNMFKKISSQALVAQVYEKMGNYVEAAAHFERAEYYVDAARCYEKSNNTVKAREVKLREKSFQDDDDLKTMIVTPGSVDEAKLAQEEDVPSSFFTCDLFEDLQRSEVTSFWHLGSCQNFDEHNSLVLSPGPVPEEFFIVLSGEVSTSTGTYREADVIGSEWLLLDASNNYEYHSVGQCSLWKANKVQFLQHAESLLGGSRRIYQNLAKLALKREGSSSALAS